MKNDQFVLTMYRAFVKDALPSLNYVEEKEKEILSKAGWLNKKHCYQQIKQIYSGYHELVDNTWGRLYSTDAEFEEVLQNVSVLRDGKSITAETEMQMLVEQFFYSLTMVITPVIMRYDGIYTPEVADQLSDTARRYMHGIMEKIEEKCHRGQGSKAEKEDKPKASVETPLPGDKRLHAELLQCLEYVKNKYDDSLIKSDAMIEAFPIHSFTYKVLKEARVNTISDIFSADYTAVSNLLNRRIIFDIQHGFYKLDLANKKETQLKSDEYRKIVESKNKLAVDLSDACNEVNDLHQKICEVESEYEKVAAVNNLFVDFSMFESEWVDIDKKGCHLREKMNQLYKDWLSLDKDDYVQEIKFQGPSRNFFSIWCIRLSDYAKGMAALMHKLGQKAKGYDYSLEEYQKDLAETEMNRVRYLRSCDRITGNQITISKENNPSPLEAQPFRNLTKRGITMYNYLDHLDEMTDEEVSAMLLQKDPRKGKWADALKASPSTTPRKLAEEIRDFSL